MKDRTYRIRGKNYRLMGVWGQRWHLECLDEPGSHYTCTTVELRPNSTLKREEPADHGRATLASSVTLLAIAGIGVTFVGSWVAQAAAMLGGVG